MPVELDSTLLYSTQFWYQVLPFQPKKKYPINVAGCHSDAEGNYRGVINVCMYKQNKTIVATTTM